MSILEKIKRMLNPDNCGNCKYWDFRYDCFGKCKRKKHITDVYSICRHHEKVRRVIKNEF